MLLARASCRSRSLLHARRVYQRWQSTLEQNPHIFVFPHPQGPAGTNLLTLLPTSPPTADLAIASTTALPPTPETLTENPRFLQVLQSVVADNATSDPYVQALAKAFASNAGSTLGSGGLFFPGQSRSKRQQKGGTVGGAGGGAGGGGAGGASAQGGVGGGGVGGFVHVSDQRNPPDWGRIAYSEDILGSVQVDADGNFVGDKGEYQPSGTYRVITREGILGLSPFLREKLTERLQAIEKGLER